LEAGYYPTDGGAKKSGDQQINLFGLTGIKVLCTWEIHLADADNLPLLTNLPNECCPFDR
jgi:hypothetical protein